MLFPFFLKGIYKNGKHTRNIWPWLPFVWSNEFIIMSLVFLFGVILLGNSFSQYLLRQTLGWHRRYTVNQMDELRTPLRRGGRGKQKWQGSGMRALRGERRLRGMTSHSSPERTCPVCRTERRVFVWLEHRGTCRVSLVCHAGLYFLRFGKILQAFKQEGHTGKFMFHKDHYRACDRGPASALLQEVRREMLAERPRALSVRVKRGTGFRLWEEERIKDVTQVSDFNNSDKCATMI